ncbi:uncharacterized protein [Symphalangus syndactylus]|uniref:uncharacterized protein n=1 Tax=Symphalangus syndactylus TaxID=9590 RepID=UPI003003BC45
MSQQHGQTRVFRAELLRRQTVCTDAALRAWPGGPGRPGSHGQDDHEPLTALSWPSRTRPCAPRAPCAWGRGGWRCRKSWRLRKLWRRASGWGGRRRRRTKRRAQSSTSGPAQPPQAPGRTPQEQASHLPCCWYPGAPPTPPSGTPTFCPFSACGGAACRRAWWCPGSASARRRRPPSSPRGQRRRAAPRTMATCGYPSSPTRWPRRRNRKLRRHRISTRPRCRRSSRRPGRRGRESLRVLDTGFEDRAWGLALPQEILFHPQQTRSTPETWSLLTAGREAGRGAQHGPPAFINRIFQRTSRTPFPDPRRKLGSQEWSMLR